MISFRKAYDFLIRFHDLWILLAWASILAGIMLNTFYHRACYEFTAQMDSTSPCQSLLDLGLIFATAVGAGAVFLDERLGILGFLPAHILASFFFVTALVMPSLLGLTSEEVFSTILSRSLVLVLRSQFPIALFFSFIGGLLGLYVGSKLPS